MSAEWLSGIAAIVLSLALSYIPGLKSWWDALSGDYKRLILLGLLVVVAAASYGLTCLGWGAGLGIPLTCDQAGLLTLVKALIAAIIASQAVYLLSPGIRRE